MPPPQGEITSLLREWQNGDKASLNRLIELVYDELRHIAARQLRDEQGVVTLRSTVVVNEAYLRLVDVNSVDWHNRAQFFAIAARIIRNVLVDYARQRRAEKRGGMLLHVDVDSPAVAGQAFIKAPDLDLLAVDQALESLAKLDSQQARVVELRFFGGLSVEESADVLGISPATVKRDWAVAKGYIAMFLSGKVPAA